MSDSAERNCNKCIHHTSGMCDSWDCKMQTVEDVKKDDSCCYPDGTCKQKHLEWLQSEAE